MKAITKIYIVDENNEKVFGNGPFMLLTNIKETGSILSAAKKMDMSYTKALKLISTAEKALGFPLIERSVGGKDGGGSKLTENAIKWLTKFSNYKKACETANKELYKQYFN